MNRYVKWVEDVESSSLWGERDSVFRVAFWLVKEAEWRPEGREEQDPATKDEVHVPRGAVFASVVEIARRVRRKRTTVRAAIDRLEAIEFLARIPGPCVDLISIVNYDRYNPPTGKLARGNGEPKHRRSKGGVVPLGTRGGGPLGDQGGGPLGDQGGGPLGDQAYKNDLELTRTDLELGGADKPHLAPTESDMDKFRLEHPRPPRRRVDSDHIAAVLAGYGEGMQSRLGFVPPPTTTDRSHARDLVLRHGLEHAIELARAYPRLEDAFLQRQGFPFRLLAQNTGAVEVHLRGLGPRKRHSPTDIPTDPNDPGYDADLM